VWGRFIIGYMGYGPVTCVMKFGVTSRDNRAVFQRATGIDDSVTQFGFETDTPKSDKHTKKQMKI